MSNTAADHMSSQDVTVWQPRASMTQIVVTLVALFGAQLPVVWFLTNDGSLWERVLPLAIYVLGLLLVCWWLLPILKKPGVFIRGDRLIVRGLVDRSPRYERPLNFQLLKRPAMTEVAIHIAHAHALVDQVSPSDVHGQLKHQYFDPSTQAVVKGSQMSVARLAIYHDEGTTLVQTGITNRNRVCEEVNEALVRARLQLQMNEPFGRGANNTAP